jgi:hypothetical protein
VDCGKAIRAPGRPFAQDEATPFAQHFAESSSPCSTTTILVGFLSRPNVNLSCTSLTFFLQASRHDLWSLHFNGSLRVDLRTCSFMANGYVCTQPEVAQDLAYD